MNILLLYEEIYKCYGGNRIIMVRFILFLLILWILLYILYILYFILNIFIKEYIRIII